MANRHPTADQTRKIICQMNHSIVLDIAMMADLDPVDVSAHHGVVPNAGMIAQSHIAQDDRAARDVDPLPKSWLFAQVGLKLVLRFVHAFQGSCGARVNFSTYLPIISVSTFTASPTFRSRNAVTSKVCGMIHTAKRSFSTFAIVRLMPSSAIEPLDTI